MLKKCTAQACLFLAIMSLRCGLSGAAVLANVLAPGYMLGTDVGLATASAKRGLELLGGLVVALRQGEQARRSRASKQDSGLTQLQYWVAAESAALMPTSSP